MTLGEKIKEARKHAGLSQEQLSEKLSVSRSAVAKWETDNGLPDIENLKALANLLDISVDYLLDSSENMDKTVIKEVIDLSKYSGNRRTKKDKCIREKYKMAKINPLLAKEKLTKGELVFDNLLGIILDAPFGTADVYNSLKNSDKQYYLVEQNNKQYLVLVSDEFIFSQELAKNINTNKFEIDNIKFTKCSYEVK